MSTIRTILVNALIVVSLLLPSVALAQGSDATRERFGGAATEVERRLEEAIAELAALRAEISADIVPRSRTLSGLEQELADVRREYQRVARLFDSRTLEISNLNREIKARGDEVAYLSNLFSEYARNFEARLHITELQRHAESLALLRMAAESETAAGQSGFEMQLEFIFETIARIEDALGGTRFEGHAVDPEGIVREGRFVLLGPAAIFRSDDGAFIGTAEQRLGSLEPAIVPFAAPLDAAAADALIVSGEGRMPFDPTLGAAHRIAAAEGTLWEHIEKGGPVMVPIFVLAGASLLVALLKMIHFTFVRAPSGRAVKALLTAIDDGDRLAAERQARRVGGPAGRMLAAGIDHLGQPRELIEEVMYEAVLRTRLKLQRLLPFIAICAAAAPLLGLLGTVTGIIQTFKLITIFGSGDIKMLSDGISQALITTEYGLITAIPALLLHALLSRRAKGITDQMEIVAMQVINRIGKSGFAPRSSAAPPPSPTSRVVEPKPESGEPVDATAKPAAGLPKSSVGAGAGEPGSAGQSGATAAKTAQRPAPGAS